MKLIVQLLLVLAVFSSTAQERDHSNLNNVYADLVDVFKSLNDQKLKEFCNQLIPNESTLEYMRNNTLCYRGIPCKMDEQGFDIKYIGDRFYPRLLEIRNELFHDELLDNLFHIDTTEYKWEALVFLLKKVRGYNKPVPKHQFTLSMERYYEAQSKADSLGVTLNELLLNGQEGKIVIVKGTETYMQLQSGDTRIEYLIGEMVLIDKKWSLFTSPNSSYEILSD